MDPIDPIEEADFAIKRLYDENARLRKVAEAARDIDERNDRPAHIDYCDWENNDRTECCCGMNELRAALAALDLRSSAPCAPSAPPAPQVVEK